MAICASSFWTLASGTSADKGVVREELGTVLLPGIDSTGVVSVVSEAACIAVRAYATIQARLSPGGGKSGWGSLCGANSLA